MSQIDRKVHVRTIIAVTKMMICEFFIPAYTVAELGEMFPRHYQIYSYPIAYDKKLWDCTSSHEKLQTTEGWERGQSGCPPMFADTEADARAKMLIYLKENKLI